MTDKTLCQVAALVVQAIGAHGAMVSAAVHVATTHDTVYRERMMTRFEESTALLASTYEELQRIAEEVTR